MFIRPGIAVSIVAALCMIFPTELLASTGKPNVILIVLDDASDYVGYLEGHPQAYTPNIDALASEGIAFTNAHAPVAQCLPSRVSFLTGISPARSGVRSNADQPYRNYLPDAVTLPEAFRDAGYFTVAYGKLFHPEPFNTHRSGAWNIWKPWLGQSPRPPAAQVPINGVDNSNDWGPIDRPESSWREHKFASLAVDFLRNRNPASTQPFFLAFGTHEPHSPFYVPAPYYDLVSPGGTMDITLPLIKADDLDDVGPHGRKFASPRRFAAIIASESRHKLAVHSYVADMAFVDRQIGRVLQALEDSAFADNTIVVLVSDHGQHMGEKLSFAKRKLWEEDTRVPMVFRLPADSNAPAATVNTPVSISALYPTLLDLAGIAMPDYPPNDPLYRLDYRSLVPLFTDPTNTQWSGPAVTFSSMGERSLSLRFERYRFTLYDDGFSELYDHENDPNEWFNLAGQPQYQQLIADWTADAHRYLAGNHLPFGFADDGAADDSDPDNDARVPIDDSALIRVINSVLLD